MSENQVATLKHIKKVEETIFKVIKDLLDRSIHHDRSKLESPEVEIFEEYTPKLKDCTYNSDEYKQYLKEMKVALDHHYHFNRHHPEYFKVYKCGCQEYNYLPITTNLDNVCSKCNQKIEVYNNSDISQMNLVDLIEMLCDWYAASLRHNDGDIFKSIELNQERFEYSDELKQIFINTIKDLNLSN
jgi:Iap family predicted aminopeptidase